MRYILRNIASGPVVNLCTARLCRAKKRAKHLALGMSPVEEIKYVTAVEQSLISKGNLFRRLYTTYDEQKM
jgi:hypothetical protein